MTEKKNTDADLSPEDGEDRTTVVPRRQKPAAESDDDKTTVVPRKAPADDATRVVTRRAPADDATRVVSRQKNVSDDATRVVARPKPSAGRAVSDDATQVVSRKELRRMREAASSGGRRTPQPTSDGPRVHEVQRRRAPESVRSRARVQTGSAQQNPDIHRLMRTRAGDKPTDIVRRSRRNRVGVLIAQCAFIVLGVLGATFAIGQL